MLWKQRHDHESTSCIWRRMRKRCEEKRKVARICVGDRARDALINKNDEKKNWKLASSRAIDWCMIDLSKHTHGFQSCFVIFRRTKGFHHVFPALWKLKVDMVDGWRTYLFCKAWANGHAAFAYEALISTPCTSIVFQVGVSPVCSLNKCSLIDTKCVESTVAPSSSEWPCQILKASQTGTTISWHQSFLIKSKQCKVALILPIAYKENNLYCIFCLLLENRIPQQTYKMLPYKRYHDRSFLRSRMEWMKTSGCCFRSIRSGISLTMGGVTFSSVPSLML